MTIRTTASVGLALILTAITTPAFARHHTPVPQQSIEYDRHSISGDYYFGVQPQAIEARRERVKRTRRIKDAVDVKYAIHGGAGGETQILPHPAGCSYRLFCGCGASVRVFGHPVRDLYLASNWGRFPSAQLAPGMAAWRHGHVFIVEAILGGNMVMAYDANSGNHLTRLHPRSVAGYHIVDPRGGRYASN